jgi:Ca2+-binding EF-hand superfamily protein
LLENETEKAKQQLALKADFNLLDAFKVFDLFNVGEIYKKDLENGFIRLGVYGQPNEIDLLFRRYDSNGDHRIRYLEFVDAFTPKDKIYANHLQNKKPNY